jgi:hypothetical protein
MSDYRELEERLRKRHLLGDCVLAADVIRALCAERIADREALKADNERLREALGDAREALFIIGCHPIKHDPQAHVVVRGIAETAIDDADAALSAVPSDSPADVKTSPQKDVSQ